MKQPDRGHNALRCRVCYPLSNETPARGIDALAAPLYRLDDAVIVHREGRVREVLPYASYVRTPGSQPRPDEVDGFVLPGLVNCHGHLELAHMSGQTVSGQGFAPWLESLIRLDRTGPDPVQALDAALSALAQGGTAMVGDISSRIPELVLELARKHGVEATVFLEMIGHDEERAARLEQQALVLPGSSLAGHALYTTSPECMLAMKQAASRMGRVYSMHLAEHPDEEEFLTTGKGTLAGILAPMLPTGWKPPEKRPVPLARDLGLLDSSTLAVHCVELEHEDARILAVSGCFVCLCPRSNRFITGAEPPLARLVEAGAALCLGTDSLASNHDLDLWGEVRLLAQKNILPGNAFPRLAVSNGAHALGRFGEVGTLAPGAVFCYSVLPDDLTHLLP